MRTILAVIAGYAIFLVSTIALFVLSGQDSHAPASTAFMISSTLYGMTFAFAGGYVAGVIARRGDRWASTIVAVLIALAAGVSAIGSRDVVWTQVATIGLIAPSALLGGLVHRRRVSLQGPQP